MENKNIKVDNIESQEKELADLKEQRRNLRKLYFQNKKIFY